MGSLSILGRYWATSVLPERSLLCVLKSYFDSSGKVENRFITLAGVAASDELWAHVEKRWDAILKARKPAASYFHSVEASHLRKGFSKAKGWDDTKVESLTSDLLVDLSNLNKERHFIFSVSLDMRAYRDLQAKTYQMDSPAAICTRYCTDEILNWYISKYKGLDVEAAFYFDQNEPFEAIFKADWEREIERNRVSGAHSLWSHIVQVGSACQQKTPGIQIADMLAWGVNRVIHGNPRFSHMAPAINAFLNSHSKMLGEEYLRREFRPLIWQ